MEAFLSLRVHQDCYGCLPSSKYEPEFASYNKGREGRKLRVPVVRVFGYTRAHQLTCLHVHGYYPYFFVKIGGRHVEAHGNLHTFLLAFEEAMDSALSRLRDFPPSDFVYCDAKPWATPRVGPGDEVVMSKHVARLSVRQGVDFYGFHEDADAFVKIELFQPFMIKRLASLLLKGRILGASFQPYECHVDYLHSFLIDNCLYHFAFLDVSAVQFRPPLPEGPWVETDLEHRVYTSSVPFFFLQQECRSNSAVKDYLSFLPNLRQTVCELEGDVQHSDMLNRSRLLDTDVPPTTFVPSLRTLFEEDRQLREQMGLGRYECPEWKLDPSLTHFPFLLPQLRDIERLILKLHSPPSQSTEEVSLLSLPASQPPAPPIDEWVRDRSPPRRNQRLLELFQRPLESDPAAEPITIAEALELMPSLFSEEEEREILESQAAVRPVFNAPQIETIPVEEEDVGEDVVVLEEGRTAAETALEEGEMNVPSEAGAEPDEELLDEYEPVEFAQREEPWSPQAREPVDRDLGPFLDAIAAEEAKSDQVKPEEERPAAADVAPREQTEPLFPEAFSLPTQESSPEREGAAPQPPLPSPPRETPIQLFVEVESLEPTQTLHPLLVPTATPERLSLARSLLTPSRPPLSQIISGAIQHSNAFSQSAAAAFLSPPRRPSPSLLSPPRPSPSLLSSTRERPFEPEEPACKRLCLARPSPAVPPSAPREDPSQGGPVPDGEPQICLVHADLCQRALLRYEPPPPPPQTAQGPQPRSSNTISNTTGSLTEPPRMHCPTLFVPLGMVLLSVEVFPLVSQSKTPSPAQHPVQSVYYSLKAADATLRYGCVVCSSSASAAAAAERLPAPLVPLSHHFQPMPDDFVECLRRGDEDLGATECFDSQFREFRVRRVADERHLLLTLLSLVVRHNPDALVCFETDVLGWRYLFLRAHYLGLPFLQSCSRTPYFQPDVRNSEDADAMVVTGRFIFSVRRYICSQMDLKQYDYQFVHHRLLSESFPYFSPSVLSEWHRAGQRRLVDGYFLGFLRGVWRLLDAINYPECITELCAVVGVSMDQIYTRGSQFFIESCLFRITRTQNYVLLSPSREQVHQMAPLECLPMVLEPRSQFYADPVVVLDFQSMYPSIMIAYNYCFSTCLGRLDLRDRSLFRPDLGVRAYQPDEDCFARFQDHLLCSPNQTMFVDRSVREGTLSLMVAELLRARLMLKTTMKSLRGLPALERVYDLRQQKLKMIINTTYGYVGASYSGRMPCSQIADAIVETGRSMLKFFMELVRERFQVEVVYGDTDSMFVHLPGRTLQEAFVIGREIAETVSGLVPQPMKLLFEKVYYPCFLITKKRYVGRKFESPDDPGVFEDKGIETVRRDNCELVQRMLRKSLNLMFKSRQVERVERYFLHEVFRVFNNEIPMSEFILTKKLRSRPYVAPVPSAVIVRRQQQSDPDYQPYNRQRVSFLVIYGPPDSRLMDLVVPPAEFFTHPHYRVNYHYYIRKHLVPTFQRIFGLLGLNVLDWLGHLAFLAPAALPVVSPEEYRGRCAGALWPGALRRALSGPALASEDGCRLLRSAAPRPSRRRGTIDDYYEGSNCFLCGGASSRRFCDACLAAPQRAMMVAQARARDAELEHAALLSDCARCCGSRDAVEAGRCTSLFCSRALERARLERRARNWGCWREELYALLPRPAAADVEDTPPFVKVEALAAAAAAPVEAESGPGEASAEAEGGARTL